jgi:5-methylcytosine-specific restriction endonuclease McrA
LFVTPREASIKNLKLAVAKRVANGRTTLTCECCGKTVSVQMSRVRKGWRYCSWECRTKSMVGDKAANANGGQWMLGENNINYKHGLSSVREPRDLTKVNRWRRRVYEKDGYKCKRCGYDKGKRLQAHHIKSWIKYPESRFNLDNGVTLCIPCHRWVHSKKNIHKEYICK